MTKLNETQKNELLQDEQNILQAVLGAAHDIEQTEREVEIARNGQTFFSFSVQPLSQTIYEKAQESATRYKKDKRGYKIVDSYSLETAQTQLIYHATKSEDREKIWDNRELWKKLNVLTGHQVISKVLLPGEIRAIAETIDELSGFSLDAEDMAVKKRDERDELKN